MAGGVWSQLHPGLVDVRGVSGETPQRKEVLCSSCLGAPDCEPAPECRFGYAIGFPSLVLALRSSSDFRGGSKA